MADNAPVQPRWNPKTRIGRGWFITLNLLSWAIVLGSIWFFVFRNPAYAIWAVIIAVLLTVGLYVLRIFRMNDISADTQKELWKSGNMMWAQGWLLWIAPSSSSEGGSLWEATAPVRGKQGIKVMGRNFLGMLIMFAVILAISLGVNHFLTLTPSTPTPAAQNPNQEGPRTAHITLALGDNESTTLSVAVPAGYIGNDESGGGAIIPDFSRHVDTPDIQFSSQPATQLNLSRVAQQVVLDSDTNQEDSANQPPATAATGTFLGYPAWFITATNDRPAKTIVFQVGDSTNMIEIQVIYSPGDPASEHQQVDDILNSITISSSSPLTVSPQSENGAISTSTVAVPEDNGAASIAIISPSGGETWQLGQEQTIKWSSVGVKNVSIYIHFPDGAMCNVYSHGILPASPGEYSFILSPTCPNTSATLTSGQYTINITDSDPGNNNPEAWSQPFNIVAQ